MISPPVAVCVLKGLDCILKTKEVEFFGKTQLLITNLILAQRQRQIDPGDFIHPSDRDRHRGGVRTAVAVTDGVAEGVGVLIAYIQVFELVIGVVVKPATQLFDRW